MGAVRGVYAVWTGSLSGAFGSLLAFGSAGGFSTGRHVGGSVRQARRSMTVEAHGTRVWESHMHLPLDGIAATMPTIAGRCPNGSEANGRLANG